MRIVSLTVTNYRSITTAYKLPLSSYAAIIGPNNEGKSNILRGAALGLSILAGRPLRRTRNYYPNRYTREALRIDYDWTRDFPLSLQASNPKAKSEITLEFEFSADEFQEFKRRTGLNLQSVLKARVKFDSDNQAEVEILMKGKSKQYFAAKKDQIISYLREGFSFLYIPSVRTPELTMQLIEQIIEEQVQPLFGTPEYKHLMDRMIAMQTPILNLISGEISKYIKNFIPNIRHVSIQILEEYYRSTRNSYKIMIDDGSDTELRYKGDGIISLTAISLFHYLSEQNAGKKNSIILLEEPESHLHPNAIHELKSTINSLSQKNQIIITTHSPILIDRTVIGSNIVVGSNKAAPAKKISDIRNSLGIRVSDNLTSAYLAILVEGETDKISLTKLFRDRSPIISNAIKRGDAVIQIIGGTGHLSYFASFYKNHLCKVFAILDNDQSGRNAAQKCVDQRDLTQNELILLAVPGFKDSELEDLFKVSLYNEYLKQTYSLDLLSGKTHPRKKKWAEHISELLKKKGKLFGDQEINALKYEVAHAVVKSSDYIENGRQDIVNELILGIEKVLEIK